MDLRDRFAAQLAAALVGAFTDADQLARRAYDLAEAMIAERSRRVDREEARAIEQEPRRRSLPAPPVFHGALLDEPEPMMEPDDVLEDELDPRWLEPPYDPTWDLEPRWSPAAPAPVGPGLARTVPEEDDAARKERAG